MSIIDKFWRAVHQPSGCRDRRLRAVEDAVTDISKRVKQLEGDYAGLSRAVQKLTADKGDHQ